MKTGGHMDSKSTSIRITFFVVLSIIFSIFFSIQNSSSSKKTLTPKAQTPAFFGFNIHSLPLLSPQEINQTLSMVSQCSNTTVVRFWGFSGGGDGYQARLFNAIENIGKVLDNAPANIQFIITLSNYYSQGVFQPWPDPQQNPTQWYGSDWKRNGFGDFVNAVTTKYKGSPKILMWEIMNEPNCTGDQACTEAQHQFLKEASDIIARNDPGKLISPGLQGQNTGGEHFDNGDYEAITQLPNISANSCHLYAGPSSPNSNLSKANCLQALEITKRNDKLFYIGEFGGEYGCTSAACTNTCPVNTLEMRKNEMMTVAKEFTDAGTNGVLVWQFSPERNPTLTCDGSSVFPGDPFCSIQGNTTLTNKSTANNKKTSNTGQQTTNKIATINFNPQNPKVNTSFKVIIASGTGFTWVHMKIFDKDGKKLIQEGGKKAGQPIVSKIKDGYQWTYDAESIKEKGDYKVIFYSSCDKGCKEQSSRILSMDTGKNNETQNVKLVKETQQQNQAQPKTVPQQENVRNVNFCKEIAVHGPKNKKLNLVILPSGYSDNDSFLKDVQTAISSMNKTNLSTNIKNKINFYAYIDITIDLPANLCNQQVICIDQETARNYAQACGGDAYVVMVNNKGLEQGVAYGICSQEVAVTNKVVDGGIRPFPHELGHSIACLNDEYLVQGQQDLRINCSADSSCQGWQKYPGNGCYPICSSPQWFKSTEKSAMNHFTDFSWEFNPPSLEGWDISLQNYD